MPRTKQWCGQTRTVGTSRFICVSDPHPNHPDTHHYRGELDARRVDRRNRDARP